MLDKKKFRKIALACGADAVGFTTAEDLSVVPPNRELLAFEEKSWEKKTSPRAHFDSAVIA